MCHPATALFDKITLPVLNKLKFSVAWAGIKLPWATDSIGVCQHFIPVSNPPNGAARRKNNGEHLNWDTKRF